MTTGRQRGFSILEALGVLALVGIVLAGAVPAISATIQTHRRNGAARHLLSEIRSTQSLAVARREVFGLQWGPDASLPAEQYRIAKDTTGTCGFPPVGDPADNDDVIRAWSDVSVEYAGMTIQSIVDNNGQALGGVMFNALGASVNTCTAVSYPVTVTLADSSGTTRSIEIRSAGSTRLQ